MRLVRRGYRIGPDDDGVEDRDDLVGGQAGGLGVGADLLGALAFVDAERADLAALLAERVAPDPAHARTRFVTDFSRFLAGDFQILRSPPAVATKDSVKLHLCCLH